MTETRPLPDHNDKLYHWVERTCWPGVRRIVWVKWDGKEWYPGWSPAAAFNNGWIYVRPCEETMTEQGKSLEAAYRLLGHLMSEACVDRTVTNEEIDQVTTLIEKAKQEKTES